MGSFLHGEGRLFLGKGAGGQIVEGCLFTRRDQRIVKKQRISALLLLVGVISVSKQAVKG